MDSWPSSAFVQISNKYLCTFACNTSYSWESLPHRSADAAQGPLPAPPMKPLLPAKASPYGHVTATAGGSHSSCTVLPHPLLSPSGPRPEFSASFLYESGESFCSAKYSWGNVCLIGVLLPCGPGLSGALSVCLTFSVSWSKFFLTTVPLCLDLISHMLPLK